MKIWGYLTIGLLVVAGIGAGGAVLVIFVKIIIDNWQCGNYAVAIAFPAIMTFILGGLIGWAIIDE